MIVAGMDPLPNSTQNSQSIKGNVRPEINNLWLLMLRGWQPRPFVSICLLARFGLSRPCVSN